MAFDKEKVENSLENSKNINNVYDWYPEQKRLVFEPRGYKDKEFSIRQETMGSIERMGWVIVTFYDGFVEIEPRKETLAEKKLEEIRDIV